MTLKKYWIAAIAASMMSMGAVAQVSGSGSASGNASVTPGQAGASASANQSANAGKAGASTSTSTNQTAVGSNAESAVNAGSAANVGSSAAALSSGTTMQAELTKSLDAKKAKPGDQVTAKLTQDVKENGKVVLHKGSKLRGHVTEAQAKSKENAESKLGVVFDKAELKGGQEIAFNGVIQALAPPVSGSLSLANDESANMGGMSAPSAPSMGGGARGGGTLGAATGAVSPAVGSTVGAVGRTAGSATGAVNNTVGGAANATLNTTSRGVVGLQGLALNTAAAGSAQGSVISSADKTVKLDSGTQMVLQVAGAASAQ